MNINRVNKRINKLDTKIKAVDVKVDKLDDQFESLKVGLADTPTEKEFNRLEDKILFR